MVDGLTIRTLWKEAKRRIFCYWPYLGLTEAPFSTMSESGSDPMRVSPSCWRESEAILVVSSAALWRIFRRTNPIHYRRNIFKRNFSQWRNTYFPDKRQCRENTCCKVWNFWASYASKEHNKSFTVRSLGECDIVTARVSVACHVNFCDPKLEKETTKIDW